MNFALRRCALIAAQKEYIIPPEYCEIESISFTGQQWFDTGIYLNNNTRIELDITPTTTPANTNAMYLGAYDGTNNCVISKSSTAFSMLYQHGARGGGTYTTTIAFNTAQNFYTRKIIDANGEEYIDVNGTRYMISDKHTYTCGLTAYFGNVHRASGSYPAWFDCRKSKWYEDGTTLSRFYVPVRRLSDDLGGMYDVVNNTFNPSMTSTPFVKGADV